MHKSKQLFKKLMVNFARPFEDTPAEDMCSVKIQNRLPQKVMRILGAEGNSLGQIKHPVGITMFVDGELVVADRDNNCILIAETDRNLIRTFGSSGPNPENINKPTDVRITSLGNIILTDTVQNSVKVFSKEGEFLYIFSSDFGSPHGLAITQNDYLLVSDVGTHTVNLFNPEGTLRLTIGGFGFKPHQLDHPYFVTVSRDRKIIIADSGNRAVKIFTFNGTLDHVVSSHLLQLKDLSINEDCGLSMDLPIHIHGLCVDSDDNILIIINGSVCVLISGTYQLLRVYNQDNGLRNPRGITCSSNGLLAVTEPVDNVDIECRLTSYDKNARIILFTYNSDYFIPFCRFISPENNK